MHRIDTATAQKDKFGAGKNGFTRGNPQTGTPATDLDDDYFDMLQEELCAVAEFAGLTLEKGKNNQLLEALFRIGAGAPAIGIPFFWPSASMPNTVVPEWSDMVFLKNNGASFSGTTYPKLALIYPGLTLPETRGEFIRTWDDGRGVDTGRALLSAQGDAIRNITGSFGATVVGNTQSAIGTPAGVFRSSLALVPGIIGGTLPSEQRPLAALFDASTVVPTATENRPRNIAFNFLVRAK